MRLLCDSLVVGMPPGELAWKNLFSEVFCGEAMEKKTLSAVDSEQQNKKAPEQIEDEIKGAEGDVTTEKKRCFYGDGSWLKTKEGNLV